MKRSEMIKLIKDHLTSVSSLPDNILDMSAMQLLGYIEDAGMIPPEAEIPMMREISPGQDITWYKKDRQWEKE